jgi:hypothetical protein
MAKGYWIARIDVADAETYKSYVAAATPAYQKFGAKFWWWKARDTFLSPNCLPQASLRKTLDGLGRPPRSPAKGSALRGKKAIA